VDLVGAERRRCHGPCVGGGDLGRFELVEGPKLGPVTVEVGSRTVECREGEGCGMISDVNEK